MTAAPEEAERLGPPGSADDSQTLEALRRGDELAFTALVGRYHHSMVRVAMLHVSSRAVAEEVVQETWLGVLEGLDRFEARASLKTWIFRILTNRAKTRAAREGRSVAFSSLLRPDAGPAEPAVDPDRFLDASHPQWPHHWASPPRSWGETPEERLLAQETRACIQDAIEALPPGQRAVIALRDIEGQAAGEVCELLGITDANQRALLHRARSRVRRALEQRFEER